MEMHSSYVGISVDVVLFRL